MNVRLRAAVVWAVALLSLGWLTGCSQRDPAGGGRQATETDGGSQHTTDVDPHDVPITEEQTQQLRKETAKFADAVAKVKELRDAVERETESGLPKNPLKTHQALDKVDIVVQWLPKIARDDGIPKENWETITTAANQLRESFDTVHQNIDNRVDPDFASVRPQIDAKIAELEAIAR